MVITFTATGHVCDRLADDLRDLQHSTYLLIIFKSIHKWQIYDIVSNSFKMHSVYELLKFNPIIRSMILSSPVVLTLQLFVKRMISNHPDIPPCLIII